MEKYNIEGTIIARSMRGDIRGRHSHLVYTFKKNNGEVVVKPTPSELDYKLQDLVGEKVSILEEEPLQVESGPHEGRLKRRFTVKLLK